MYMQFNYVFIFRLGILFVHGGCGLEGEEPSSTYMEFISAFHAVTDQKGVAKAFQWALSVSYNEEVWSLSS